MVFCHMKCADSVMDF